MKAPDDVPHVLVFDSGLGGLSVLSAIQDQAPGLNVTYVADDAGFPYGVWQAGDLVCHISVLMGRLIDVHDPDLVVVACNTASTLVLPILRNRYDIPFVGTVPAIKPAAEQSRSRVIAVLATPGTVERDYTGDLIHEFAGDCSVVLVGSKHLARLAEDHLHETVISDEAVMAEISECFFDEYGKKTDCVVLGCTHFPFLIDHFRRLSPWPVAWIDPAPAIARRVVSLVGDGGQRPRLPVAFVSTSDLRVPQALAGRFGLTTPGQCRIYRVDRVLAALSCFDAPAGCDPDRIGGGRLATPLSAL